MPAIRLLPITGDLARALDDPVAFAAAHAVDFGEELAIVRDVVRQSEAHRARIGAPHAWGGHLAVDEASGRVVGTCAFVGGPDADGAVEIAYHTFPPFERRGYGGAMARALVAHAERTGAVRTVYAHTLPQLSASTRILSRAGFVQTGTAVDPDEGTVWRWERALVPPTS